MLLEVRLSPQLHRWIYGFFPHSFAQMMREGGFRPVVFMGHGLLVAIFTALCALAAAVHYRLKKPMFGAPPIALLGFILLLLVICKSMGALMLGLIGVAALMFLNLRLINFGTAAVLVLVISYPVLSFADLFPHDWLVEQAAKANEERADSLSFRFNNEEALLGRALEKPWFGWGGYGRARYDDSTTDGYWIITVGNRGLVGFFALFGTAAIASISALRASANREASFDRRIMLAMLALGGTMTLVDQLPNASMHAFAWFIFGVMYAAGRSPTESELAASHGRFDSDEHDHKGDAEGAEENNTMSGHSPQTPASQIRDHYLGRR